MRSQTFGDLLRRYPPRFQPLAPLEPLGGGGGLSGARLWRFRAEAGRMLLRAWPPHGPGRQQIEQVHHWLFLAEDLGFVPAPVRDSAGHSLTEWLGTLWEVTPWMAGSPDPARPPTPEHLRLAFTSMAAFHQRLAGEQIVGHSAGLRQRHAEVRQLVGGGFEMLEAAILRQSDATARDRVAALGWLSRARTVAPSLVGPLGGAASLVVRTQPVLRDARSEHFLFEGDRLSGLVDFGAMGIDSIAADLARLIGDGLDGDPDARREALAAYERIRPLDPAEARLIGVFEATTALLIGERWVRWHYLENRHFDDPEAVSKGLERGVKQLDRLVRGQFGPGRTF